MIIQRCVFSVFACIIILNMNHSDCKYLWHQPAESFIKVLIHKKRAAVNMKTWRDWRQCLSVQGTTNVITSQSHSEEQEVKIFPERNINHHLSHHHQHLILYLSGKKLNLQGILGKSDALAWGANRELAALISTFRERKLPLTALKR